MGRWWTGYASIADGRACIVHSHGALWRFAPSGCRRSSYGYGLFEAQIPSEKMCLITVYGVRVAQHSTVVMMHTTAQSGVAEHAMDARVASVESSEAAAHETTGVR